MSNVRIVIKKSARKLFVYRGGRVVFQTQVAHGKSTTPVRVRRIKRWVSGAVSYDPRYPPYTWFSFGATFAAVYRWPAPGTQGSIRVGGRTVEVRRIKEDMADVKWQGEWWPLWKDSNPFGMLMADLSPGAIHLHGTAKDPKGEDVMPDMIRTHTHGCVRVSNAAIKRIRALAPVGTLVSIEK